MWKAAEAPLPALPSHRGRGGTDGRGRPNGRRRTKAPVPAASLPAANPPQDPQGGYITVPSESTYVNGDNATSISGSVNPARTPGGGIRTSAENPTLRIRHATKPPAVGGPPRRSPGAVLTLENEDDYALPSDALAEAQALADMEKESSADLGVRGSFDITLGPSFAVSRPYPTPLAHCSTVQCPC